MAWSSSRGAPWSAPAPGLFRQHEAGGDLEGAGDRGRAGIWLAAADRYLEFPFRHHGIAGFCHHAHIARLELEVHLLRLAGLEVDALERAQCADGRSRDRREREVE